MEKKFLKSKQGKLIEINCMSFYIKLITEFSEASTYDLLALYKNLCVCVAALEHFLLLFFPPLKPDTHELCLLYLPTSNEVCSPEMLQVD